MTRSRTPPGAVGVGASKEGGPSGAATVDGASSQDRGDTAPADAAAVLESAAAALGGRSVRGEATFDPAPGLSLSTIFEVDADGDVAVTIELPPGIDPEFPDGARAWVRFVDGLVYGRVPTPAVALAEPGVDEVWTVVEPPAGDPATDVMGPAGALLCVLPQSDPAAFADCDPLGDVGVLLHAARGAEIVGREDVRGTDTTRVRFEVLLLDLAKDAFGQIFGGYEAGVDDDAFFDDGAPDPLADDAFFDDGAPDPLAEGLAGLFSFLDAGFVVEAWIDDESLTRRAALDLAAVFSGLAGSDEAVPSSLITVEFFDFGADISVDAPPPEAVVPQPSAGP